MTLTCGARSTVNIDRSTVNTDRVRTGPVGPGYGLNLGRAGPDTWRAVALPRHSHGPLLGSDSQRWLTVDQEALVYGPKTGSMVDQVHPSSYWLSLRAPSSCVCGRQGDFSPASLPACSRRRCAYRRASAAVLAPNWRGKKHRQALATAMVVSGRRLRLPRSLATANGGSSTTSVRGWRGCSGIGRVYGARERHSAPAGMLGRSRGPLGPPVALAMAAAFRARWRRRCGGYGHGEVYRWGA